MVRVGCGLLSVTNVKILNLIASLALVGLVPVSQAATWTGHASFSFTGSSTLHDFHGHGETESFSATVVDSVSSTAAHVNCRAVLKVGNLVTGNKSRDKSMYAMFRIADFPVLEGELNDVEIGASDVPLVISILGQEQTVSAKASDWKSAPDAQSFKLSFDVSLAKSGLKAPRAAAGLIKVADVVAVTVQVELTHPQENR